ncbi:unnamed protein product [Enterobius vermicularis]|uniref:GB1/RHD3-type G domain-containing protein n=1 Tax=Enterobius vermicularis TaxID=51028 RepID=A0A158QBE0_ENTVE|nr:unnamed protein product [Enterobius vermicularis]
MYANRTSSKAIHITVGQLQLDDLKRVEMIASYGSYAECNKKAKPFQTLLYVVRDWTSSQEYRFGFDGGKQYFCRYTENGSEEIRRLCKKIDSCFLTTSCFLMPHPGLEVAEAEEPYRCIRIREVFLDQLKSLARQLLSTDHLSVKMVAGYEITFEELFEFFHYLKRNGAERGEANLKELHTLYTKGIDLKSILAKLKEVHDTAKREALEKLEDAKKSDGGENQRFSRERLEDFCDVLFF